MEYNNAINPDGVKRCFFVAPLYTAGYVRRWAYLWHFGFDQLGFALRVHAVHGKNVLGEINSNDDNAH